MRRKHNKKYFKLIFIIGIIVSFIMVLGGCGSTTSKTSSVQSNKKEAPKKITVFAAASLTESYNEIAKDLKKDKNIEVSYNFAGSQQLVTAIDQGANADVFASADTKNMDKIKTDGKVDKSKIFANNQLIIAKYKDSSISITSLKDLAKDGVKLVVGDKSVPCGSYFYKALDAALKDNTIDQDTYNKILKNIKSNELNVKDIVSKVTLGEADAGVVYKTDVVKSNKDKLQVVKDAEFSKLKIEYPVAVINSSSNKNAAQEFIDYITTGKGKDILKKYGFIVK